MFMEKYFKRKKCDENVTHDMYLPQVRKSTLSIFVGKRSYLNEIQSTSWN